MKALIIEPATSYQLVLRSILGEFHIESICAKNGTDALELLNDNDIDLVCSAIHLSDMSGIDLCKTIRTNNQGCHNLPIIVITSEENKTLLTEALKGGATRTFHKHDLELFSAYIRDFISHEHHEHRHLKGDVLYIEDCKVTSSLVISVLEESELNVTHHDTAEAALTALSDGNYDLIITDLGLGSGMSGAELVETLRTNPTYELLPILVVTADTKVERRIELLENGANDYICKPLIPNELIARAINLIKSKKLYDKVEHQRQALREMAMKDQLTGLYNRHFLMEIGPKRLFA